MPVEKTYGLKKELGYFSLTNIVIGDMIGAGIFTTSGLLLGTITLSLPTAFKTYSRKYLSPGQVIKLNSMIVKLVKVTRRQVQFEISGKIEDLVQLKLYNAQNELISEPFEFKHIQKDSARLTLLYNDEIETIKLVLAQFMIRKDYPFSFTEQLSENN